MNENYQNGNNKYNQVSISTSMMTIWDSATGAQLKLSILNNGLGIAIWLPVIGPDGSRTYPSENRFSTVLNQKNALAFEKIISEYMIPSYERGTNLHMGVFTNSNRSILVELEVRDGNFYFLMHRGCDPTTRVSKDTIRFKFDSTMVIDGYDVATGEMNVVPIQADFFVFAKAINAFNDLAGGMYAAHGASVANNSFNNRFMTYIRAIAESVHAQLPAPTYQQSGGYNPPSQNGIRQNYNTSNSMAVNNLPPVTTTEVTSLSDLVG